VERDAEGRVVLSRGAVIGKDVVTRTAGRRLGSVSQLWVDVDAWRVDALDLRESRSPLASLGGEEPEAVLLSSLRQIGDVILVHDDSALEPGFSPDGLLPLVGYEVVTEGGTFLGRVRDLLFRPDDGAVSAIVYDTFGQPFVPDSIVSTYRLPLSSVVAAGVDYEGRGRVIATADAASVAEQRTRGLLERIGLLAEADPLGYTGEPVDFADPAMQARMREAAARDPAYARQLDEWAQSMAEYQSQYGAGPAPRRGGRGEAREAREERAPRPRSALPAPGEAQVRLYDESVMRAQRERRARGTRDADGNFGGGERGGEGPGERGGRRIADFFDMEEVREKEAADGETLM